MKKEDITIGEELSFRSHKGMVKVIVVDIARFGPWVKINMNGKEFYVHTGRLSR